MNPLIQTIDGIQEIVAICPCCGELFRLAEAKFIFPKRKPKTCEYLELVAFEKLIADAGNVVTQEEDLFEEWLEELREPLRERSRKQAKKRLREIDPTFSGREIDPQDVRPIFHPVEYIIFHGLCSGDGVDCIEFISRSPENKKQEAILKSIDTTLRKGYVEFEILRLQTDGSFDIQHTN